MTRQRRYLLELLETSPVHLDVAAMIEKAREKGIHVDRATVYRTMHILKEHGLIDELDLLHLEGTGHFYELRDTPDHVHIGCTRCGRIVEHETALLTKLRAEVLRRTGFEVESIRTELAAVCSKCRR